LVLPKLHVCLEEQAGYKLKYITVKLQMTHYNILSGIIISYLLSKSKQPKSTLVTYARLQGLQPHIFACEKGIETAFSQHPDCLALQKHAFFAEAGCESMSLCMWDKLRDIPTVWHAL